MLSVTLMRFDQIPAHIVERVSWWALTMESGITLQKAVSAEPPINTVA